MKPLAPNTLLQNRYLVVNLIGKGGMGEVYLAVDQRLGSAIALKRTFFSNDEMLRAAFEREARTLARLRHSVLPKVSDHFTEEETQYLIMEHISGDDLAKRLEITQKPFPVSWVMFWADQLLDALNYLHSHEPPIIHRDIKPQNLKLTDDNSIVLLDFGLSKNSPGQTKLSTTGSVVGFTPYFAPMEQVRGTGTDARSDIYSLSATFYQLLTNVVPPDALSRADALLGGLPDPLRPINEINPEVTQLVSNILLRGMEVSQEKRFSTARSMQKALREAFAQLQNEMSAKTAAYIPDIHHANNDVKLSQLKTELMTKPVDSQDHSLSEDQDKTEELRFEQPIVDNPVLDNSDRSTVEPDFNATLHDASIFEDIQAEQSDVKPEPDEVPVIQSNIKTEVFLAGTTPELTAAQESNSTSADTNAVEKEFGQKDIFPKAEEFDSSNQFEKTDDFHDIKDSFSSDDFSTSENQGKEEVFSPFSNVPLFTADDKENFDAPKEIPSDSMVFDSIVIANETPSLAANDSAYNINSQPDQNTVPPVVKVAPPKTKSSRKGLIIAGVLGLFFIFLLSAAGLGFYFYQNSISTNETPTPTPITEPSPEATPTAEISPEPTLETIANTNSANDNSSVNNSNSDINSNNTNIRQPDKPIVTKTPETPKPVKTVEPPPVRTTPKPTPAVTTPKTPKPITPKATPLPRILP